MNRRDYIRRQKMAGGLTIFTAVFVLILMTLMLLYATRVSVYEQRVSSNEARQKVAFHAAELAVDQGLEYIAYNAGRLFEASAESVPDGSGGHRAGWFANDGSTPGWQPCTADMANKDNHPCGGDIPAGTGAFFYDDPATIGVTDSLPLNTVALPANSAARVSLVMCLVTFSNPGGGCQGAPADDDAAQQAAAVIQLMGYGYADCTNVTDLSTCKAEARIARPLSNFKNMSGAPTVPLTTKSTFPPTGTAEVVANPNAGGVGVPISVWSNNNSSCSTGVAATGNGSFATCEMHEWYGRDKRPDGITCDLSLCSCSEKEALSYTSGSTTYQGIDLLDDEQFPCDLFQYYFAVPRGLSDAIKGAATIVESCDGLGPDSAGLHWVSGPDCVIDANQVIGSAENPIILISAASTTTLVGGTTTYGVLYIFDGEDSAASLESTGNNIVYGSVIVDASMGNFNGTFQVVYNDAVLTRAAGYNGLGRTEGGWRDFGLPAWQ